MSVYYLDDDRGRIKIGYSRNVLGRISEFKTLNPEIELMAQECGEYATESARHKQFQTEWIGGEWFLKTDRLAEWVGLVKAFGTLSSRLSDGFASSECGRKSQGWLRASGVSRASDIWPEPR